MKTKFSAIIISLIAWINSVLMPITIVHASENSICMLDVKESVLLGGIAKVFEKQKLPTLSSSSYIETYTLQESGKVKSYNSTAWIDARLDRCYILGVSNGSLKVSLPTSNGRIIRDFKANLFTAADLRSEFPTYRATADIKCFRRKGGAQAFGEVFKTDVIYILNSTDQKWMQILYPITGTSRWRMCWTQKSNMKYLVPITTKLDFINGQKNGWFQTAQNALSNMQSNKNIVNKIYFSNEFLTRVSNALGGIATGSPINMVKAVVNPENFSSTLAGLVLLGDTMTALDQAITYNNKVLAWKNRSINNSNWESFLTDIREAQASTAVARSLSMKWINKLAGLTTAGARANSLFTVVASGFMDGVFGSVADADLSKSCTRIINICSRTTTAVTCLTETLEYLHNDAYNQQAAIKKQWNEIIKSVRGFPN